MSLHDIAAIGWAKLILVWDYPMPLGLIFVPALVVVLLPLVELAVSTGSGVVLRHKKAE